MPYQNPVILWPVVGLVVAATVFDLRSRRIPSLLTAPLLLLGLLHCAFSAGLRGVAQGLLGILTAVLILGVFCYLRGMGMGDLKLCAAIGAWIGPSQLGLALLMTGMVGGLIAAVMALWNGTLSRAFRNIGRLVCELPVIHTLPILRGSSTGGAHRGLTIDNARCQTMPYAPAIALGTILSFFGKP